MKKIISEYKPFLLFLGKFLLSYLLLTFVYQQYLNSFDVATFEPDGLTKLVANQTEKLLLAFDADVQTSNHPNEPSVILIYNKQKIARVIEGCNGLSVLILFMSFVIAFSGRFKQTIIFILLGILIIHIMNVSRIALLVVLINRFPQYTSFLHEILFPLIIYGSVFLLWVFWVNNYSNYATKSTKK